MSRDLSSTIDLPGTPAEVFALRTSASWVEVKAERLRDGSTLVERTEEPSGAVRTVVSRNLPAGGPGFLDRFLPADGKVVQRETWQPPDADGVSRGTWTVEIPGTPARLGGDALLSPHERGCRQVIRGTAKVSLPLVGGKAEQYVADMSTKLIAHEGTLMTEVLRAMTRRPRVLSGIRPTGDELPPRQLRRRRAPLGADAGRQRVLLLPRRPARADRHPRAGAIAPAHP